MSYTELLDTAYGKMLVPKFDAPRGQLLRETGRGDDHAEVELLCDFLRARRPNPIAMDIGANVGCFTLAFAPLCRSVYAFEPQLVLHNMLCGSLALNGFENVRCYSKALGAKRSDLTVPVYDYSLPGDFGCLELKPTGGPFVGQTPRGGYAVECQTVDLFEMERLDVLKIDVEGMELEVLRGAEDTIQRCRPIILVEHHKSNKAALQDLLHHWDYTDELRGRDLLAVPCAA